MNPASAEPAVVALCRSGLDLTELQRQVLAALRQVMTIDAAFFATADPETLLFTGAHSEDPLIATAPLFLDNELSGRDVNTFPELVRAPGHVRSLDTATRSAWGASPRYRDIMRPIGLGDELRAALVVGGHCWGYLCLHREDGAFGFTAAEVDLIRRLAPHIAHALRQAVLLHRPVPDGERRPGVVLLDERMELVASTPQGRRPAPAHRVRLQPAAAAGQRVLRRRRTPDGRPATEPAGARRHRRLAQPARLQAVLAHRDARRRGRRARQPHSTLGVLLAAYGLTARELDVARHVLRGDSTKAIANTLHISAHTVQDHLKSVFDKVGVRSRRDLVGRLLAGVSQPLEVDRRLDDGRHAERQCRHADRGPAMLAPLAEQLVGDIGEPVRDQCERGSGQVGRGAGADRRAQPGDRVDVADVAPQRRDDRQRGQPRRGVPSLNAQARTDPTRPDPTRPA